MKSLEYELYLDCCKNSIGCDTNTKAYAFELVDNCVRKLAVSEAIEREKEYKRMRFQDIIESKPFRHLIMTLAEKRLTNEEIHNALLEFSKAEDHKKLMQNESIYNNVWSLIYATRMLYENERT